ncbi:hypothetical protein NMY22_g13985 [Coprinellus aureogranulatus]|nr:hypothetical protein NMY22_g13985 [Coprinellus aureogranulatus]
MSSSRKRKVAEPAPETTNKRGGLFVLEYSTHKVLITSPKDHDRLQESIRRHFPHIPQGHRVSYWTKDLEICEGSLTEVSPDVWTVVIPLLSKLTVQSSPDKGHAEKGIDSSCDEDSKPENLPMTKKERQSSPPLAPQITDSSPTEKIQFTVWYEGSDVSLKCRPSSKLSIIYPAIMSRFKLDHLSECDVYLLGGEGRLGRDMTLQENGVEDGDDLDLLRRLVGGKPVIYLMPPAGSNIEATVTLSLVPEWEFSAVYPVVPTRKTHPGGKSLQWNVTASPNGTILEKTTGLEVSFLFWEAEALKLAARPAHPQAVGGATIEPMAFRETFDPTRPHIDVNNSVVLEVANITPYLDKALQSLGLHTEARTSFITYWLPSMLKHKYVALRFLPQKVYERAAPLEVSPAPDVTARIFMLFKGIKEEEVLSAWRAAVARADLGTARWRSIVGLSNQSLTDESLFRVVEWGGMEVNQTFDPVQALQAGTEPLPATTTGDSSTVRPPTTSVSQNPASNDPTFTPPLPTSANTSGGSRSNAGPIAGGVVGGVVALVAIGLLVLWFILRRRRTRVQKDFVVDEAKTDYTGPTHHRGESQPTTFNTFSPPLASTSPTLYDGRPMNPPSGPPSYYNSGPMDMSDSGTIPMSPSSAVYTTLPGRRSFESLTQSQSTQFVDACPVGVAVPLLSYLSLSMHRRYTTDSPTGDAMVQLALHIEVHCSPRGARDSRFYAHSSVRSNRAKVSRVIAIRHARTAAFGCPSETIRSLRCVSTVPRMGGAWAGNSSRTIELRVPNASLDVHLPQRAAVGALTNAKGTLDPDKIKLQAPRARFHRIHISGREKDTLKHRRDSPVCPSPQKTTPFGDDGLKKPQILWTPPLNASTGSRTYLYMKLRRHLPSKISLKFNSLLDAPDRTPAFMGKSHLVALLRRQGSLASGELFWSPRRPEIIVTLTVPQGDFPQIPEPRCFEPGIEGHRPTHNTCVRAGRWELNSAVRRPFGEQAHALHSPSCQPSIQVSLKVRVRLGWDSIARSNMGIRTSSEVPSAHWLQIGHLRRSITNIANCITFLVPSDPIVTKRTPRTSVELRAILGHAIYEIRGSLHSSD